MQKRLFRNAKQPLFILKTVSFFEKPAQKLMATSIKAIKNRPETPKIQTFRPFCPTEVTPQPLYFLIRFGIQSITAWQICHRQKQMCKVMSD